MNSPRPALLLALLLTIGFLSACQSTDPVTPVRDSVAADDYPNIVLDPVLEKKLVRTAPTVQRAADGQPLRISVPIRSISQKPMNLQYRVIYFDRYGKQTNRYPVWKDIHLMARARHIISDNAVNLDASDWTIEIKPR